MCVHHQSVPLSLSPKQEKEERRGNHRGGKKKTVEEEEYKGDKEETPPFLLLLRHYVRTLKSPVRFEERTEDTGYLDQSPFGRLKMRLSLGLLLLSALAASALEEEVVNEELNAIIVEGEKKDFFKRCRYFHGFGNISSIKGQISHSGYYVLCCTGSAHCRVGLLA